VVRAVAIDPLEPQRAPQEQLRVAVPGEAEAAVELHRPIARPGERLSRFGLGHSQRHLGVLAGTQQRGCVVQVRSRAFKPDQEFGACVLERLVAADLAAEGGARVQVLDHHVERAGDAARRLGARQQQRTVTQRTQRCLCAFARNQPVLGNTHAVERQRAGAPGPVDHDIAPQGIRGKVAALEHHQRRRAVERHRHHQQGGHFGVADEGLGAAKLERPALAERNCLDMRQRPVTFGFENRGRGDRAAGDARQPVGLLRLAASSQRALNEDLCAPEGACEQPAPHRLGNGGHLRERQAAAAEALGHRDSRPAQGDHLVPDGAIEPVLGGHLRAYRGNRRLVPAEDGCRIQQHRLFVGENDILGKSVHGFSPSGGRARARR